MKSVARVLDIAQGRMATSFAASGVHRDERSTQGCDLALPVRACMPVRLLCDGAQALVAAWPPTFASPRYRRMARFARTRFRDERAPTRGRHRCESSARTVSKQAPPAPWHPRCRSRPTTSSPGTNLNRSRLCPRIGGRTSIDRNPHDRPDPRPSSTSQSSESTQSSVTAVRKAFERSARPSIGRAAGATSHPRTAA